MTNLPKRNRITGIGKSIGGNIYIYKDYEHTLPVYSIVHLKKIMQLEYPGFVYNVVKVAKNGSTTFFLSLDFDTADEPTCGVYVRVTPQGTCKTGVSMNIWHHKWLFVADSYAGFDVEKSKSRSLYWLQLKNVDKSRIGNQKYWKNLLLSRASELTDTND